MFKSFLTAITVIAATTASSQAVEFVNTDNSTLTNVCIAAAQSNNFSKTDGENILCNGISLKNFVKQYGSFNTQDDVHVSFVSANSTPETELCVAAATSNDAFAQAKANYSSIVIRTVACNGVQLAKFAKRYNKSFNG